MAIGNGIKNRLNTGRYGTQYLLGTIIPSIARYVFLIAVGYILLYPLFFIASAAFRTPEGFMDPSITWIPKILTTDNFVTALNSLHYKESIFATIKYEIVSALFEVATCAITAYGLARFDFKIKKFLMVMLIITILVPEQMTIVPKVTNFSEVDLFGLLGILYKIFGVDLRVNVLNTGFCFWLPSLLAVGLKSGIIIYIYIQFFKGLPKELEEAAWIDGATPFVTFIKIIIPSSTVVIFTNIIFSVIWHYNDYYLAVMYMNKGYPLAVSLAQIETSLTTMGYWAMDGVKMGIISCCCLIFIAPILIMYLICQRKFIKSIDRVGITG